MQHSSKSQGETGKTRSQRIQLDYHRQPDAFHRWRWRVAIVAAVACLGYVGIGIVNAFTGGHYWARQTSTGPLAHAHAAFEHDCSKCHGSGFGHALAADAWRPFGNETVKAIEQSCNSAECHQVSHHFINRVAEAHEFGQRHCAMCHRDHLGRDHNLAAVANEACTNCHADINAVLDEPASESGSLLARTSVTAFTPEAHGDFNSLSDESRNRGAIKFNHFQHMQPGQAEPTADGSSNRSALSIDQLQRHSQARYATDADGLVQLSCHDCHELGYAGSGELTETVKADGNLGRYLAPIDFDRHCAACHDLNYGGQTADDLPLPHAAPSHELLNLLRVKLQKARQAGAIWTRSDARRNEAVPGVAANTTSADEPLDEAVVGKLWDRIKGRCLQCHEPAHITDEYVNAAASGSTSSLIPKHWLLRGAFDHSAHYQMDCRFCHGATSTKHDEEDHKLVMIEGIESCTPCHRPSHDATPAELIDGDKAALTQKLLDGEILGAQPTWASDDCTTCHRYHWTRPEPVP